MGPGTSRQWLFAHPRGTLRREPSDALISARCYFAGAQGQPQTIQESL